MALANSTTGIALLSKFRGCLVGALLGDCLGSPFEFEDEDEDPSPIVLQKFFEKLEGPAFKTPKYPYTDDSAMTKCITQSFVNQGCLDEKDLARRFVTEFYSDRRRSHTYGQHVVDVFEKLRAQKYAEPFKPASEQFNGSGSYGNGGAMRVAPVALFCHSDYDVMLHVARQVTKITHTHTLGINGAILQCLAVHQGLKEDPTEGPLNVENFTENLLTKMASIEEPDDIDGKKMYHKQLQSMMKLLSKQGGASLHEVRETLGNSVTAIWSVPTAIYSFLRAQSPIPGIETDNQFRRTIQYAISLGGDTDTIASMAGAIAGAYLGEGGINKSYRNYCEGVEEVLRLADDLYKLAK